MVVRLFHPWVGGTERQAHKLSKALIARGVAARVVTGRWYRGTARTEVLDGVPVTRHGTLYEFFGIRGLRKFGGYLYMLTLAWHLWRTRDTYDVIHVHGLNYHTGVAALVARRLGKPIIVKLANSGMASDITRMRRGQQLAGSRLLLPAALGCDRLVALSPAIAEELRAAGVDEERIVSLPNGVDTDGEIRLPDGTRPLRLVYVGRLHFQKGVDVLIEACSILTERAIPVQLRIVGDGPERSALETLVAGRSLGEVVEFMGELGDPRAELDSADVFVLPSRTEGMSNALLEAMAAAKAPVATGVSGSSELIDDNENGLVVGPEDPDALADALARLATETGLARRLADAARRTVRALYSISEVAARYSDLYAEVVTARAGVQPPRLEEVRQ